jgi:hypothetical protein
MLGVEPSRAAHSRKLKSGWLSGEIIQSQSHSSIRDFTHSQIEQGG